MKISVYFAAVLMCFAAAMSGRAEGVSTQPAAAPAFDASQIVFKNDEVTAFGNDVVKSIGTLVSNKDFDELDKLANNYRTKKGQTGNGTWHLLIFYTRLCSLSNATDIEWTRRIYFLRDWVAMRPESITARVGLARCYMEYALHAQGSGNSLTPDGRQLSAERLAQAKQALTQAKGLRAKCPVWWDTMQCVALGEGWDRKSYDALFDEAVAFDPGYTFYYNNKVEFLLPLRYGRDGEWQAFAAQAADKIGGEAGDILYARIHWRVHERSFFAGLAKDSVSSWPRIKAGLQGILKQDPNSLGALNELAYLSAQKNDAENIKAIFQQIDLNADNSVWSGDRAHFMHARTWALAQ